MSDQTVLAARVRGRWRSALRVGATACGVLALAAQTAQAQVLIMAPHPDDEALMASGIVSQARQRGQTVKVVVATNGDCEVPTIGPVREQESVAAMGVLGLAPEDVIFLGYPDCGLYQLYYNYPTAQSQYTSMAGFTRTYASEGLGRMDYHRYLSGASAPYNGFWVIEDLKTLFRTYKPQDVYVTSAYDDHPDHYVLNYFVGEALLSLIRSDATFQPTLHDAIVHAPCELCDPTYVWPMPTFTPTAPFPMPPALGTTPLGWSDVESVPVPAALRVTNAATNLKYQAIARYASQGGPGPWLESFVKSNEIFWKWELWANLALKATASASSAIGAVDRLNDASVVGAPRVLAEVNGKGEWVSNGELAGAWAQLTWPTAQALTRIVLHDRPDPTENISSGTLTFSDGSRLAVGALPTTGVGLPVTFALKTVTWVRFTVTAATGSATGLAEMEAYGPSAGGADVAIDFGPAEGLWLSRNPGGSMPQWSQLHDLSPTHMAMGDVDGTGRADLIVDFPGYGVWIWSTDSGWRPLHPFDVTDIAVGDLDGNGRADVILSFPGAGLYAWMNNTTWVQLSARPVSAMAIGNMDNDSGHRDELIVTFPGAGVWVWKNNATWVQLHPLDATRIRTGDMDGNGKADVLLDFPGYGLWTRMNDATWIPRHALNSSGTTLGNLDGDAGGRADLVVDFPGYGLWALYNETTWRQLSPWDVTQMVTADLDGNGQADLIVSIPGAGIWIWMNNTRWIPLHPLEAQGLATGRVASR
jgi:LmbE family N-acetylglucosaminyl deacetylase